MSRMTRVGGVSVVVVLLLSLTLPALANHRGGDGDYCPSWRWWCDNDPPATTTTTAPTTTTTKPKPTTTTSKAKATTTTVKATTTTTKAKKKKKPKPTTTTTIAPTTTTTMPSTTTTEEPGRSEVVVLGAPPGGYGGAGGDSVSSKSASPESIGDLIVSLGSDFFDIALNGLGLSLLAILVPLMVAVTYTARERHPEELRQGGWGAG